MKKIIMMALVFVAASFTSCKYFRGQIVDGPGMEREVDSLSTDTISNDSYLILMPRT